MYSYVRRINKRRGEMEGRGNQEKKKHDSDSLSDPSLASS